MGLIFETLSLEDMEFPHLGDQCDEANCRQLDFLPVKCDGCKKKFCSQHWTYEGHKCSSPRLKDVQVPVCPLCDQPVPSKPGAVPDEAVSRHLDRDCQKDRKRNPRCSKVKCKVRELIKVDCNQCGLNFCLKHRRQVVNPPPRPNAAQIQGNLSEDEALARALQASLGNGQPQAAAGNGNTLTQ